MYENKNNLKHILLVGDNGINNQFIQREIEKYSDFSFSRECILSIERSRNHKTFDVVLISYLLLENIEDINIILSKIESSKWVVYDVPSDITGQSITVTQLFNLFNIKGMIYQDAPIEHLTRCLKTVCDDDLWLPRKLMSHILSNACSYTFKSQVILSNLTKREAQIFKRVVRGDSNLEISSELFISESTVKTHVYNIYKKINVTNRKEAIRKAHFINSLETIIQPDI
ncbi:response regulator transcription factor [Vibrio splendidus]|uniref:response regulator transcription factor n=1 Tax=Vibrio splendidus TaxID=29497 RepID=UPI0002ED7223|nr:response regulator transcription factor [Vibrio splendidus]OEF75195.1 helix-turn-helix transcriptional regulator [Vibrio splendidus 1F-157]PTP66863.1 DNA-binding response regulator [Vibrio splendidus]